MLPRSFLTWAVVKSVRFASVLVVSGDWHVSGPHLIVIKFVNQFALEQVTGINRVALGVVNCRHLEQEHLVWGLLSFYQLVRIDVEQVRISQELAREASQNQNVLAVSLDNAAPLSLREQLLVDVNQGPRLLSYVVVSLNRVYVFSGLIGDTAEYKYGFVLERARRVVVSADIEIRHFKPKIDISVVHFCL